LEEQSGKEHMKAAAEDFKAAATGKIEDLRQTATDKAKAASSAAEQAWSSATSIGSPSVPVTDRGGEKVNVGFRDFGAGSSNQLRDPRLGRSAGND
jgi:hypothetical protein